MGVLQVSSTTPGATVLLDMEEIGVTPLAQKVPPGAHNVRVTLDGHDPWVMRVEVAAGSKTNVHAKLLQGGNTVEFLVEPTGSVVRMGGKLVGKTPIRLTGVSPGDHTWSIQAPLFESLEGRFHFRAGQNHLVHGSLVSSRGLFEIESTPLGASVVMDGEAIGVTPLALEGVAPGVHRLRFEMKGRPLVLREVDTSDGSKGVVSAALPKRSGRLLVNTGHEEGRVILNDQEVGLGRFVFLKVARGQYNLRVVVPDLKDANRKLRMPAKGGLFLRMEGVPEADAGKSRVVAARAWNSPWLLYTAAGVGGAGVVTGVAVLAVKAGGRSDDPDPTPQPDPGDVVVYLP
jgi:hypothetical protein